MFFSEYKLYELGLSWTRISELNILAFVNLAHCDDTLKISLKYLKIAARV